ncbi:DUF4097 family beta strand repeat-containing protein [Dinghuibacter silviterrae]|uniref:Adhesin n=1 Tax=Dinghuibacter silviterrae TaxID=1539049 RepID=A0A4R8DJP6_9BACT|nr:hypothetical protein [Dinghuibacter silviterrae]TDW97406.1 hypothetical protein EDB95_5255 [Dinghuibacter silviterrae]
MKTIILALGLLVSATLSAQDKPYLTKSFAGSAISEVEVETSGGGIQMVGTDPSQSRVEVYIRGNNGRELSNAAIAERLDKYYIVKITLENGKLTATCKQKEHDRWNSDHLNIGFHVYAPTSASTHLNTSGGGIKISHLKGGAQMFNTSGGGLEVSDITGKIDGSTSGGGIHVDHCSNSIRLTTSGGGIHADHLDGSIYLETSGGGLELTNLSGTIEAGTSGGGVHGHNITGDLKTSTSGGSIDLDNLACTLDGSTSGGGVHVTMTGLGKYVKLSTSAGSISLSIPSGKGLNLDLDGNRVEAEGLGGINGSISKDHISGTVNGGGIPVHLDANSGHVLLTAK